MNHDHTFRIILILGVLGCLAHRHLPSPQVPSDGRKTRPLARGPLHLIHVTNCRRLGLAGNHRLPGQSVMDGMVVRAPAGMAAVDGSRRVRNGRRVAYLDLPQPRQESDGYRGKNLTDTVVTRREHSLVTSGPYAWVRHPFYDTAALGTMAISLIAANWFILLTGFLVVALLIVRTKTEEEKLLARFGDSYREYMERTGRFIPRIGRR